MKTLMKLPLEIIDQIAELADPITRLACSFVCRGLIRHRHIKKMELWTHGELPSWAKQLNCFVGGSVPVGPDHMPTVIGVGTSRPHNLRFFQPTALAGMEDELVHGSRNPYQQRTTVHLNNSVYQDRLSLPSGYYFMLPFDACAFIEAVLVGSSGSSAFLKFVVEKRGQSYRILRFNPYETLCTDDRMAYTPLAIDLGITILLREESTRFNAIFTSLTVK